MGQENQRERKEDLLPSRDCLSPGRNRGCDGVIHTQLSPDFEYFPCVWKDFLYRQRNGPGQTEFMIWKWITTGCYIHLLHHQASMCASTSTKLRWSTRNSCSASFKPFWISAAALHDNVFQFSLITCESSNLSLQNRAVFTEPGIFTQRETEALHAGGVVYCLGCRHGARSHALIQSDFSWLGTSAESTATSVRATQQPFLFWSVYIYYFSTQ